MWVEVSCVEGLQQLLQTRGKITLLALDPAQCTVRVKRVETEQVSQIAKLTLTTKLNNSKRTSCRTVIVCQLKSLYDTLVIKCKVDLLGPRKYHIQYTPAVHRHHELTVSVEMVSK